MIIGTAGHVDHGKTTLVRALTGTDTDRLAEEKARGISIELGYAYAEINGATLGFIDVPGHERFVHTMLAGASGIDFALLVVAADDGIMPQTREHVAILKLLGIAAGTVAITKADRVDAARLDDVAAQVAALLAGSRLATASIHRLDARDPGDRGLEALRAELGHAAARARSRRRDGLFRLCIDRAFTLPGHGTIATGTAEAGELRIGDPITLLPAGETVRVRSLHAQNRPSTAGVAGDRLAINLAGIDVARLGRGDWLGDPRGLGLTSRVDARLTLLPEVPALSSYAPVHVHFSACRRTAHVLDLEAGQQGPGRPAWVQIVFDSPVVVPGGAPFVIRNAQATRTLGGGLFIDVAAPARRRRSAARRAYVDALETTHASADPAPFLVAAPVGCSRAAFMRLTGRVPPEPPPAGVRVVAAGNADEDVWLIGEDRWQALGRRVVAELAAFHAERAAEPGADAGMLRGRIAADLPASLWRGLVAALLESGDIARQGPWLHLKAHGEALAARDEAEAIIVLERLRQGGFDPPWARDIARDTHLPEVRVRALLAGLGRRGRAYPIVTDLYYAAEHVAKLAHAVADLVAKEGHVDAASFRDRLGIGRKRTIQILEFFDRVGYTRRLRDGRVLRTAAGWHVGE